MGQYEPPEGQKGIFIDDLTVGDCETGTERLTLAAAFGMLRPEPRGCRAESASGRMCVD